jgi:hypothetical protein
MELNAKIRYIYRICTDQIRRVNIPCLDIFKGLINVIIAHMYQCSVVFLYMNIVGADEIRVMSVSFSLSLLCVERL